MLIPVRHHSPACARLVRDTILRTRPAAVLIEGPADFSDRIHELLMGHRPPISIYSYVAWEDQIRQGAYYPLCDYSPEWQALMAAQACQAVVRFIDLPFATLSREDRRTNRFADDRLRGSHYIEALCKNLEVENFDDAWDLIAEQDPALTAEAILARVQEYCRNLRAVDADSDAVRSFDLRRETFMAAHIRSAWAEFGKDRVIVVTGGYHTSGLEVLLATDARDTDTSIPWPEGIVERGIALTPYSYERLDSLTGYDAGMPSPGFYHEAWRAAAGVPVHVSLIGAIASRMRELKQAASTADLISVEACAQGLAALRGHARVWRRDLIDAVTAALVKDDLHLAHPFLLALQQVLRGGERGRLAAGSPLPPLTKDIHEQLTIAGLLPEQKAFEPTLCLTAPADAEKSRLLHRLRILGIPGFERTAGVDFASRADLTSLTESWRIRWMPEQDATMIEAARYGSALSEAVAACLHEAAAQIEHNAAAAALLLLDSVLANVIATAQALRVRVGQVIHEDGNLGSVAKALGHLLYLHSWDDVLGTRGSADTGRLLKEAFDRAVWLLETGSPATDSIEEIEAVQLTRDAFERAEDSLNLDRAEFAAVLARVQADAGRTPAQRGACAGALWSMQSANPADIRRDLLLFSSPEHLGDFLTGLFTLAREQVQRDPELLASIHGLVVGWNDEGFLTALPSLRLAFMRFTGREKLYLARSLFGEENPEEAAKSEPSPLAVSTEEAAQAMAFETRLFDLARQYGIDLGTP